MRTDSEIADGYIAWRRANGTPDEDSFFWAFEETCTVVAIEPERALRLILQILQRDHASEVIAILAAGPLEDLLSGHGPKMIDAIEEEARQNPKFAFLLGVFGPAILIRTYGAASSWFECAAAGMVSRENGYLDSAEPENRGFRSDLVVEL